MSARGLGSAAAFLAAAICYANGLLGPSGSGTYLATTLGALALLTLGFYLAGAGASQD